MKRLIGALIVVVVVLGVVLLCLNYRAAREDEQRAEFMAGCLEVSQAAAHPLRYCNHRQDIWEAKGNP